MAISNFEKDMKIISVLDDEPNDVGGLSADELKEKFDEGGIAIQEYINNTLIPNINSQFSEGSKTYATKDELNGLVIGVSPDLAATEAVLSEM